MPHDSIYVDDAGAEWSIRSLLASERPRVLRDVDVASLWGRVSFRRCWGPGELPPGRLIGEVDRDVDVDIPPGSRHHAERTRAMIHSIDKGWSPPPLVIGPDGCFWDGMHRLAALYALRASTTQAWDFSSGSPLLEPVPELSSVFKLLSQPGVLPVIRDRVRRAVPFPHVFLGSVLEPSLADQLLREMKQLEWRLAETSFYEQYEFSLLDCRRADGGPALKAFREACCSSAFLSAVSGVLGAPGLIVTDIACHKSLGGQQIGIHTDFRPRGERCRLTLHFNPGVEAGDGGAFVAFARPHPADAVAAYLPAMNSGILFEISANSHHAVTPIAPGTERYSVVIAMKSIHA